MAESKLFIDILPGSFDISLPMAYYFVTAATNRSICYCLADGIYPEWPIFIKPIHHVSTVPQRNSTAAQKMVRKDIEHLCSVLHGRFKIILREIELWDIEEAVLVSEVCAILHNIIGWMQQSASFDDEMEVVQDQIDMITQFF